MLRVSSLFILLCTLLAGPSQVQADSQLSEAELRSRAEAFISAKNARQQPDTRVEDIDYFITFLSEPFVDEHVKFNVTVTDRAELRDGMIAKMNDEVYFSSIEILEMMFGGNVVFVKYKEHAKVKPSHMDEVIEYTSVNILSLEFDEQGLIKHIRRHHG